MKQIPLIRRNTMVAGLGAWLVLGAALAQPGRQRMEDYADRGDYGFDRHGRYDRDDARRYSRGEDLHAVPYRPAAPYMRPPAAPSSRHVWIPAEWQWQYGRYVHVAGYWTLPPQKHLRYIPGHWNRTRYGWIWRPGYWVKKKGRAWWQ